MIHGCAVGSNGAGKAPVVVQPSDHTAIRCPEADEQQRAILKRKVGAPKRDPDGTVSDEALQKKMDELRIDSYRKGQVGLALADELARCRKG
jgi:hypothetical protein